MRGSRGRVHAVAVLTAALLPLSTAPGPATALAARGAPGEPSPRVQEVRDPRGDAVVRREAGAEARRLADLTGVRYTTPYRVGGDLQIIVRWAELRDGSRPGVRSQLAVTEIGDARPGAAGSWTLYVDNERRGVVIEDYTSDEETTLVRPRRVSVDRTWGRNGRYVVTVSTEWMRRVRGIRLQTFSNYWLEDGRDRTARSRALPVGQEG